MESPRKVTLDCTPEPIQIDLDRTAVICIDMQNAFVREGGMFDLAGWPTAGARAVIEPDRKIIEAARAAGVKVVFIKMSFKPGLTNAGGPDSPSYHKEIGMVLMRKHPELIDKAIVQGTWGERIIDELRPLLEEPVVRKQRYNGFVGRDERVRRHYLDGRLFPRLLAHPGQGRRVHPVPAGDRGGDALERREPVRVGHHDRGSSCRFGSMRIAILI